MNDFESTLGRLLDCLEDKSTFAAIDLGMHRTLVTWGSGPKLKASDDWRRHIRAKNGPSPHSKYNGWVGWFSYEAATLFERAPSAKDTHPSPPPVSLFRHNGAVIFDHRLQQYEVHGCSDFCSEAAILLQDEATRSIPTMDRTLTTPHDPAQAKRFQQMVQSALHSIQKGEIYQVNLSWCVDAGVIKDPVGSYLALRRANPAQRGAFIKIDEWILLSNSPELFLEISQKKGSVYASSIPIKGTASDNSPLERVTLRDSPKETAELTMIADLVRNDLGRVAQPGTVCAAPRTLRSCGDLIHAEQAITAKLRAGYDAIDALSAAFPPGSVTGAPKVRAMEIIADLEEHDRGGYTGCIGGFFDDGTAHWNVAIRTATIHKGNARFNVGAGIVADSQPELEWVETLAKGNMLYRGLRAE